MHIQVYYLVAVVLVALLVILSIIMIRDSGMPTRILAFDLLTYLLIGLLALVGLYQASSFYLDAALILAILSYVGTAAVSRYFGERKLF